MEKGAIAWAITGGGHGLRECVSLLCETGGADVFLSRAGEEVLGMYGLYERIRASGMRICRDTAPSAAEVTGLYAGSYRVVVIAPATSNSVAKFVWGISDTLVTNLFAQAGKSRVPILVYPTDSCVEVDSLGPDRRAVKVHPRRIDLENTDRLRRMPGVSVVASCEELRRLVAGHP